MLVAIFKKDIASLSNRLKRILLWIYQNSPRILYQPGPQIFLADWLSRHNHKTKRQTTTRHAQSMNTMESCTDISDFMTAGKVGKQP